MHTITQESFNEIVQENIDSFEMELEEAIQDALEQCKSQNIDTKSLIVDPKLIFQKEPDTQSLIKQLSDFSITCSDFKSIIDAIQSYYIKGLLEQFNEKYLDSVIELLPIYHEQLAFELYKEYIQFLIHCSSVRSGQQKIGQYTDIWNMILYDLHSTNLDKLSLSLSLLLSILKENTNNKSRLFEKYPEIQTELVHILLNQHPCSSNETLYSNSLHLCLSLCTDDDVTVPPKGFQISLSFQDKYDLIHELYPSLQKSTSVSIQSLILQFYSKLFCNEANCKLGIQMAFHTYLISLLPQLQHHYDLLYSTLTLLKSTSKSDIWKQPIYTILSTDSFLSFLFQTYEKDLSIITLVFMILSSITLRNPEIASKLILNYHVDVLLFHYFQAYPNHFTINNYCFHLLRNILNKNEELKSTLNTPENYSLLVERLQRFKQLNSIACLTLRELGYDTTKYEYKGPKTILGNDGTPMYFNEEA